MENTLKSIQQSHPNRTVITSFTSPSPSSSSSSSYCYDDAHYILHLASTASPFIPSSSIAPSTPISCALTNQSIYTYDALTLKKIHTVEGLHHAPITDLIHFQPSSVSSSSDDNSNTVTNTNTNTQPWIVSSTQDGFVQIFDLRINGTSASSTALSFKVPQPREEALSVSLAYGGTLAAVGSNKASIHFFDTRQVSSSSSSSNPRLYSCNSNNNNTPAGLLGSYVDAHTEEVTKVRFQYCPSTPPFISNSTPSTTLNMTTSSILLTAGEDGLVCIHDTTQPSEHLALKSVLNIGTPLRDVGFFGNITNMEGIYCLTGSETFSLWHYESAQRIHEFGDIRQHLSQQTYHYSSISNSNTGMDIHYLVSCLWNGNELQLLGGNSEGNGALYHVDSTGSITLQKLLLGGHKSCIRAAIPFGRDILLTGGEDSRLCEWILNDYSAGILAPSAAVTSVTKSSNYIGKTQRGDHSTQPNMGGGPVKKGKKKHSYGPY